MDSADVFAPVSEPDGATSEQAEELFSGGMAPHGGPGKLGELARWYSSCRGETPPPPVERARVVVFAGDHGIAGDVRSSPAAVPTSELADDITAGAGPLNVLARESGASVRLVDVSLDREAWGDERVARGSARIDAGDAMSPEQLERALSIGARAADQEVDSGADLLIPGSLGAGGDTVAGALVGAFTRTEPVTVVGAGYDLATDEWKQRVRVVRDAMFRVRNEIDQPLVVLRAISSPDIVALVAFCAQAAVRRTPVLLDDPVTVAAALIADRLSPAARLWFRAAQYRASPSHQLALRDLGLDPVIDLGLDMGCGAGGLAVLPLLRSAVELLRDFSAGTGRSKPETGPRR